MSGLPARFVRRLGLIHRGDAVFGAGKRREELGPEFLETAS
jgi:hypothetical protein